MGQFGIAGVSAEGGRALVIGRCFKGPITVNDVFICMRRFGPEETEEAGCSVPVRLVVRTITAYEHRLDVLDEGVTAELELSGEIPAELGDGWLVETGIRKQENEEQENRS